ncbi:hypothetical protein NDU88_002175 [Pleurodeles waltl]|uniref:L1 transposable element RRM domain-containing protein n=1 Tax=Pleurodeles waltl TaxID=8319 RepID=A0AAV7W2L9_PLEWA|nr:hypothetical protein NDU88_002175 [Pleurodeles waltl]
MAQTGGVDRATEREACPEVLQGRPRASARTLHTKPLGARRGGLAAGTCGGSFTGAEDRQARRKSRTHGRPGDGAVMMGKQKTGKEAPAGPSQRGGMSEKTGGTEALTQHTEVILVAIHDSKTALETQIATLAGEVSLLCDDHNKLKDRVKATEVTMQETTPQVKTLTQKLALMENKVRTLASKVEGAESRSQHHNIHLVGVPERAEGPSIELYIETRLSEVVLRGTPTKFFSVERAHRSPAVPLPPGAYPRPIIVRLMNFRDRDVILQETRKRGPWKIKGKEINIYPDYINQVQKQWAAFATAKKIL